MIYATSDLHGYPLQSFLNLLAKVEFGPSDQLYVIGDVIDRNGDGGVAMLRWMMKQPNVTLLRGNHEAMLLDCDFLFTTDTDILSMRDLGPKQERDLYIWHRNGALVTEKVRPGGTVRSACLYPFNPGIPGTRCADEAVFAGPRRTVRFQPGEGNGRI